MGCLKGKPAVHIQSTKAIPKPNTKTTQNWMCLKPRAVREGGKKNCMFQCRPNMRVADCATVWDCNCLQLIYLSVLRLILSEIYIRNYFSSQSNKPVSSNPGHAWPCLCLCPYVARNQGRHGDKSVRMIHTRNNSARIITTAHLSGNEYLERQVSYFFRQLYP